MKKITTLTDAEQELIARAAFSIWNECADDLLQAVAEEKDKDLYDVTVPRSVAIEIALDAGRLEERMGRSTQFSSELIRLWEDLEYDQKIAVVKRAFTYPRYGA